MERTAGTGSITDHIDEKHADPAIGRVALVRRITLEEAQRRSIFYDDDGNWRHKFLNMILRKLYDPTD